MLINPGDVRTWLYTSEFKDIDSHRAIITSMDGFCARNHKLGLSGFLITNGKAVMQLLEGGEDAVETLRTTISQDDRHLNVVTEVWELEAERAYPKFSMRAIDSNEYEALFKEVETAKIATIATNIAQLLFDTTFDS